MTLFPGVGRATKRKPWTGGRGPQPRGAKQHDPAKVGTRWRLPEQERAWNTDQSQGWRGGGGGEHPLHRNMMLQDPGQLSNSWVLFLSNHSSRSRLRPRQEGPLPWLLPAPSDVPLSTTGAKRLEIEKGSKERSKHGRSGAGEAFCRMTVDSCHHATVANVPLGGGGGTPTVGRLCARGGGGVYGKCLHNSLNFSVGLKAALKNSLLIEGSGRGSGGRKGARASEHIMVTEQQETGDLPPCTGDPAF